MSEKKYSVEDVEKIITDLKTRHTENVEKLNSYTEKMEECKKVIDETKESIKEYNEKYNKVLQEDNVILSNLYNFTIALDTKIINELKSKVNSNDIKCEEID